MKTFKEFYNPTPIQLMNETEDRIAILTMLMSQEDTLTESYEHLDEAAIKAKANYWLSKVGLKINKSDGIIDYISMFTVGTGKLFLALLKGDTDKAKEILKGLTQEKVTDFLLKLDVVTLHLVSEPIHIIDALTGWEIWSSIKDSLKGADSLLKQFYIGVDKVRQSVIGLMDGTKRVKMVRVINNIEKNMPAYKGHIV